MPEPRSRILLLAEDDPDLAFLVCRQLRQFLPGWEIRHASNGLFALEWWDGASPPDILITDLQMPGMDGFQLIQRVRQAKPWLPIFVLSSSEDPADRSRCRQLGADGFFSKGLGMGELRTVLLSTASHFNQEGLDGKEPCGSGAASRTEIMRRGVCISDNLG